MARWGLIVEELPVNQNALPMANVLAVFDSDGREDAEEQAKPHIRAYAPRHPMTVKRKRLFRTADGWLLVGEGAFQKQYPYHFRVCPLEWDSADGGGDGTARDARR